MYGYSMVIKNCSLLFILLTCAVIWGLHVEYISNVTGVFVQRHMTIIIDVFIPALLVTLLIALSSYLCQGYVAFESMFVVETYIVANV